MLPSVLTLLDFSAGPVASPGSAHGVMPLPLGMLGGASEVAAEEESVGSLRRIKSYRRYVARKSREAKRVEKKIARLEARRERIVEAAPSQPEALPTLQPLLEQLSALRSALSAIEANVSFARAQIEAADDDEDEMLLLM